MAAKPFSLWYLPAEKQQPHLDLCIQKLARRHQTQPFAPHVTGFSGLVNRPQPLVEACRRLFVDVPQFALSVQGVGHGSGFHHCVFLELASSPWLDRVVRELSAVVEPSPGFRLDPHLSLLYGHFSSTRAEAIAGEVESAPEVIHLSRIQLVHPRGEEPWMDMDDLDIWCDLALGKPAR